MGLVGEGHRMVRLDFQGLRKITNTLLLREGIASTVNVDEGRLECLGLLELRAQRVQMAGDIIALGDDLKNDKEILRVTQFPDRLGIDCTRFYIFFQV